MTLPMQFTPLKIRELELPNRIVVSPMAQYSAVNGILTDFHLVHYGKFALGGAGTIFVEESGVLPEGRITNGCLGIWSDEHAIAFKRLTNFLH